MRNVLKTPICFFNNAMRYKCRKYNKAKYDTIHFKSKYHVDSCKIIMSVRLIVLDVIDYIIKM